MREFTNAEKELIINTPITIECFDVTKFAYSASKEEIDRSIELLEERRLKVKRSGKNKDYEFTLFVRLLPKSYEVVKL